MRITHEQAVAIGHAAEAFGLDFIRLFGSAAQDTASARDTDLAIGARTLGLVDLAGFRDRVESILPGPIDIVQLRPGMHPVLVREIASQSRALWESASGRARYAELIDRLLAVAEDEILSFPPELRAAAMSAVQERLRVP